MSIQAVTTVEVPGMRPENPRQVAAIAASAESGKPAPAAGNALPHVAPVPVEDVHRSAGQIDDFLKRAGHKLTISVDQVSGRYVVQVRDPVTGDLIRQIPSDEALRIARNLDSEGAVLISELT
jgi:flagellar protein FlaG